MNKYIVVTKDGCWLPVLANGTSHAMLVAPKPPVAVYLVQNDEDGDYIIHYEYGYPQKDYVPDNEYE